MTLSVSTNIVVSTGGLDRRIARLKGVQALVDAFAQRIYDLAYPAIPEETGRDKASLTIIRGALSATVSLGGGVDPPYPYWQEMGFHHHETGQFIQNPALVPAFEQVWPEFVAAVRALVTGG